jgi:hypothetical protein
MPGMNGTGPLGRGPFTGRGRGLCNSSNVFLRGRRMYGRGYRRMYFSDWIPEENSEIFEEKQDIENRIYLLENQLNILKENLKKFNKPEEDKEK